MASKFNKDSIYIKSIIVVIFVIAMAILFFYSGTEFQKIKSLETAADQTSRASDQLTAEQIIEEQGSGSSTLIYDDSDIGLLDGTLSVCKEAVTQLDLNVCANSQLSIANAKLTEAFSELLASSDRSAEHKQLIIKSQEAWRASRDATCAAETYSYKGGQIEPIVEINCRTAVTTNRLRVLNAWIDHKIQQPIQPQQ